MNTELITIDDLIVLSGGFLISDRDGENGGI